MPQDEQGCSEDLADCWRRGGIPLDLGHSGLVQLQNFVQQSLDVLQSLDQVLSFLQLLHHATLEVLLSHVLRDRLQALQLTCSYGFVQL